MPVYIDSGEIRVRMTLTHIVSTEDARYLGSPFLSTQLSLSILSLLCETISLSHLVQSMWLGRAAFGSPALLVLVKGLPTSSVYKIGPGGEWKTLKFAPKVIK
jgi:hypothetical protein